VPERSYLLTVGVIAFSLGNSASPTCDPAPRTPTTGIVYAFGEMDDAGKSNLGAFAAQSEHRSSVDIMPVEGRVYFTRKIRA
jgi:hypothetical protein